MPERWNYAGEPPSVGGRATLVSGSTFCVGDAAGDVVPYQPQGLFVRDTRVLSTWRLLVDGETCQHLATVPELPFRAVYLSRRPGLDHAGDPGVLVERRRTVGSGMRETVTLRNAGPRPRRLTLEVCLDADLADVFEVKESRLREHPPHVVEHGEGVLRIGDESDAVVVTAPGAEVLTEARGGRAMSSSRAPTRLRWNLALAEHSTWSVDLDVGAVVGGTVFRPSHSDESAAQLRTWTTAAPVLQTPDAPLRTVLQTSLDDLGALRMSDPLHPEERPVAAGAPWFMALFGRDSLLASYMALAVDPRLASDTLHVLARHQGTKVDVATEEQPGRILHETRFGEESGLALGGGRAYYGSVDATPLFVVVLGALRRWGLGDDALATLLPAADRALAWCTRYGDRDGDGFVEYARLTEGGLLHQGWKDSVDAITFADGTLAEPPIALAEVQGYVYAALRARGYLARSLGQDPTPWLERARALQAAFDDAFWLPSRGWYALALDGDKRPVDALASNLGHCLWTGVVPRHRAPAVAAALMGPDMFTGWGLRTLSARMGAYDPMSYHNGAVWPHDTALAAAGLLRYGLVEQGRRLSLGLLGAASALGGRLPELFCGFDRGEFPVPIGYPASCSPQAWASAAPVLLLRSLLRFEPDVHEGRCRLDPVLPDGWAPLVLSQVPVAGRRLSLTVGASGQAHVEGLPPGLEVLGAPSVGGDVDGP